MTEQEKLTNSKIRHAIRTGLLPYEFTDSEHRDAVIRKIVSRENRKCTHKFTVHRISKTRWEIS